MPLHELSQSPEEAAAVEQPAEFTPDRRITVLQSETANPNDKEAAFAEIVDEFQLPLTRFATRMIGPNDAEDVVQGAFINAFRNLDNFEQRNDKSLSQWLYKITHNLTLNAIRQSQNKPLGSPLDEGVKPVNTISPSSRIGEPGAALEFRDALSVLDELYPIHRNVLILSAEGHEYETIAEIEGISLVAMKARLFRARKAAILKLAEMNGELVDEPEELEDTSDEPSDDHAANVAV